MVKEIDGHGAHYKTIRDAYDDGVRRRTMFFEVDMDDKCSVNEELVMTDISKYPEFAEGTFHIINTKDLYGKTGHVIMPPEGTPVLRTGESKSHKPNLGGNSAARVIE